MAGRSITRRDAVVLGAAVGTAATVPQLIRPGLAAARSSSGVNSITISASDVGRVLRPGSRFGLLGIRGNGLGAARLEVRARLHGHGWGPWLALSASSHRPDGAAQTPATDPVWTGEADEIQMRPVSGRIRGRCELVLVDIERPAGSRRAVARSAQAGTPTIISRATWGAAAAPPRSRPSFGQVQLGFVHHTVNANNYGEADAAAIVLAIAKYHINGNGWNDIGYNFLVDRFGRIYEGRAGGIERAVTGAQAGGWNSVSTGVAIIGTFDSLQAPPVALEAVARLLAWKLPLHGAPVTGTLELTSSGGSANRYRSGVRVTLNRISGHRDGCSTDCPGNTLYGQLAQLRMRTAAIAGGAGPAPTSAIGVTLSQTPKTVGYGQALVIGGAVLDAAGQPAAGRQVYVQKKGATRWSTFVRATTDEAGAFSASAPWRRSGTVRVAVADSSGLAFSQSVSVGASSAVTAVLKASRIRAGRRAVVSGTVAPDGPVKVLVEIQGKDKRYRRVRALTTAAVGGRYRAVIPLRTPGLYRLTVQVPARPGVDGVSSQRLFVRAARSVT